ncbi:MAG TPA: isoprenylcysteine carboxylmethyltransferase family protein [Opitutaceae bacterium]|nr:isoprenylcysteine carboxylmethyltransferase family protein [Opitutaceae bacterium]
MLAFEFAFLGLWAIWIAYWIASAWGNKRAAGPIDPTWRIIGLTAAVVLYLVIRAAPDVFNRPLLAPSAPRAVLGLLLTALGLGWSIWARRALGTNWSGTPMIKQDHELIQRGPYAIVRHPIYTGLLLGIFGNCLARAHVSDVLIMFVVIVMLVVKLKIEERLMQRQFPAAYPEYRRRTKALIPYLF